MLSSEPGGSEALLPPASQLVSLLRLRPFDTSTSEGRTQERLRRVALTVATSGFAKLVTVAIQFVSVPLLLNYLGTERYGLWLTISSLLDMLVFADLGMGNGLLTALAKAQGQGDRLTAARYVASGFFMLTAVATLFFGVFLALRPFVPWTKVFNAEISLVNFEVVPTLFVCAAGFAVSLPLDIVQHVQSGYQEGFRTNLFSSLATAANLAALLIAIHIKAELPGLALLFLSARISVTLLNGWVLFGVKRPELRPRWVNFNVSTARRLLHSGLQFLFIAILMSVSLESDILVATKILGLQAATLLAVPARLVGFILALTMTLYMPLWSAYGEAMSRGDFIWVRRNLSQLTRLNLIFTLSCSVAFAFFGRAFLRWWLGPAFLTSQMLIVGLALWPVLFSLAGPAFMVLNGAGALKIQVLMFAIFAPACIAAKVVLARQFGVAGIAWANAICYAVFILVPLQLYLPKLLERLQRERAAASVSGVPGGPVS
jgi:O-antigen/teichoic acid export membrane protein